MALVKRFSIGKKVSFGYIVIILITTLCSLYSVMKLRESRNTDEKISEVFSTLLVKMDQMQVMIDNTKKYTNNWIYTPNDEEKEALRAIQTKDFPELVEQIKNLQSKWTRDSRLDSLDRMIEDFYLNISYQKEIMNHLNSLESYSNDSILFYVAIPLFDEKIEPTINTLSSNVQHFTAGLKRMSDELIAEKNASLDRVEKITIFLTLLSVILGAICSYVVTMSIAKPIKLLNDNIQKMGHGELPKFNFKTSSDEVGDMAKSLDLLRQNLEKTSNFALNIGNGQLEVEYQLLSEKDVLGQSLLTMRDNLLEVLEETRQVVSEAGVNGDLNAKIDVDKKSGAWKNLSESINNLLLSISKPVFLVNEIVNEMAQGNLTKRLKEDVKGDFRMLFDNLNQALNSLNTFLIQIADNTVVMNDSTEEMKVSSREMTLSTSEIASAISQMSSGAQTQVGKVDETSQLIEGILNSSGEMGKKAENINNSAKIGVENSEEGTRMVEMVVTNMNDIAEYSDKTNESINVLTDRSNQITKMLAVISEIASQTNLLALNAAIEAAQAGDAGRGFAVVADEIRKLAENSRTSAKEIEILVLGVQSDTQVAAKVIENMHESVIAGNKTSKEVSEVFRKITDASHKTLESSEEILESTQNQIADINNVVSITESVVVIAEQTASGTEEVSASATELSSGMDNYNERATELSKIAIRLKEGVEKFSLRKEEEILEEEGQSETMDTSQSLPNQKADSPSELIASIWDK